MTAQTSNAPKQSERPWKSFLYLPGPQPGILIVQTQNPKTENEWYRLGPFAALFGLEREAALQWFKDGTIPRRMTKRVHRGTTYIHRAAIPLIEQVLGKSARQPEGGK